MKAINIKWDTDNEMIDLPAEVEIPEEYSEDEVADYLSDEYGFCVFGFDIDGDEKMANFVTNELACLRATVEKGSDRYEELTNAIAWVESKDVETNEIVWGSDEEE